MLLLYIAAGGTLGTLARHGLALWIHSWAGAGFPWGILTVNVSGSFGLGFFLRLLLESGASPELRAGVAIGFFGAFTTMSTFGYETLALLRDGQTARAAAYVGVTVVLVLCATVLGFAAGSLVHRPACPCHRVRTGDDHEQPATTTR
jgi:fluoride exporter